MNIELLAPAGNFSKLKTALYYGADAVYLGGKNFSLRAFSDNFTDEELEQNRHKFKGEIQRNKGLGSLEPEQARESIFNPKNQRLDVMEYSEAAMNQLYALMGEDVTPRRKFIMENVDFSEIRE